jgi:hypothetical protein
MRTAPTRNHANKGPELRSRRAGTMVAHFLSHRSERLLNDILHALPDTIVLYTRMRFDLSELKLEC